MRRKFIGARRSLTTPERHVGSSSLCVFNQNPSCLHAADAPRSISQQHDVARDALDRKVFVYRADNGAFRMRNDGVKRIIGNCAAAGDGGQAAAAARANYAVHAVAMEVRSITPA